MDRLTFETTDHANFPARVIHWHGTEIVQIVETNSHSHAVGVIVNNILREACMRKEG